MDRRILKTRAAINKAYLELIVEKDPSKISVAELARRADIDRKTFYIHYQSPYDVLKEIVEERFCSIVDAMEQSAFFMDPFNAENLIRLLERFYKAEESLLLAIAESDAYDDLWKRIHEMLSDKVVELYAPMVTIDKERIRIYFDFFGAGVIETYRRWVKGEYSTDLHGLLEMLSEAAGTGLYSFFVQTEIN